MAVHDDFKNTIPVECTRCGFKCGDWYTENGYDVNKWMYYDFKRYPWIDWLSFTSTGASFQRLLFLCLIFFFPIPRQRWILSGICIIFWAFFWFFPISLIYAVQVVVSFELSAVSNRPPQPSILSFNFFIRCVTMKRTSKVYY